MKKNVLHSNKSVADGCCAFDTESTSRFYKSVYTSVLFLLMFFVFSNLSYGQSNTNNSQWGKNGPASAPDSPVDWANGNAQKTNSHFREDQSIPTRIELEGLTIGVPASVT